MEDLAECSHICTNTIGSYQCSCPPGYEQAEDDLYSCVDSDECLTGPCSHECINVDGGYTCACPAGYQLAADDGRTCEFLDPCLVENGGCSHGCSSNKSYAVEVICTCPDRYQLEDNTTCVPIDPCTVNNGDCMHTCTNVNNTAVCHCTRGYTLDHDNSSCADVNECARNNGNCSHICTNLAGSYACSCPTGYAPSISASNTTTCTDVDECVTDNGGCSHRCINYDGGWMCDCPLGYELDTQQRYCLDMDECLLDNGGCSHGCVNVEGSWLCTCPPGYHLTTDNATCTDIDECRNGGAGGPCEQLCVNSAGSYRCECLSGYALHADGVHCDVVPPISMCAKLKALRNGRTRCTGNPSSDGRHWPYGTRCVVWCDKGYKLIGPTVRSCHEDGTWGDKQMTCIRKYIARIYSLLVTYVTYVFIRIAVSCPRLVTPTHGRVLPSSCTTGKTFPGETCQISCRRGYRPAPWADDLGARRTIQCLPSLVWRPQYSPEQLHGICIKGNNSI